MQRTWSALNLRRAPAPPNAPRLSARTWDDPRTDLLALDTQLFDRIEAGADTLVLAGPEHTLPRVASEVLTRYQGLLAGDRDDPALAAALEVHRHLHDLSKPLVRADFLHALDTWRWLRRLASRASLALQLAALFHDVERLVSEADRRVEHHAANYQAFKDAHARQGAALLRHHLGRARIDPAAVERAAELVAHHERAEGASEELALLNDADALSFFSLNAEGYLRYFGPGQTARKVLYTWRRLRPSQRGHLAQVRLPRAVAAMLHALADPAEATA